MSQVNILDPQRIVRVVDEQVNKPTSQTYGREDFDKSDQLHVTGNGAERQVKLHAENDGDAIPLVLEGQGYPVIVAEEDIELDESQSGATVVNTGASGAVVASLPDAVPGLQFTFIVTAAQHLRIKPVEDEQVPIHTGALQTASLYVGMNTIGGTMTLRCVEEGKWHAVAAIGTWVVET